MPTDLGDIYRKSFQQGFIHYGSARTKVTYTSIATTTYNRETSENVEGVDAPYPDVYMMEDLGRLKEIPGVTIDEDETGMVVPVLDLTPTPKLEDYLTLPDGSKMLVTGIYPDNFKAMWLLKVQRIG